jgi:DNA-binding NarL/FixJ family response regulator
MTTLLLVDDQPSIRRGLRMRLGLEPELRVVGEADSGEMAVALATQLRPDVVVMDVEMQPMDGIAATRAVREVCPECAVVVLTLHDDSVTRARATAAGAAAFVAKQDKDEALLSAIRSAAHHSTKT